MIHVREKGKKLSPEERKLVRALYGEFLSLRAEIVSVEQQIMELMDKRDELRTAAARVSVKRIAEKFEVVPSHIVYTVRERPIPPDEPQQGRSQLCVI